METIIIDGHSLGIKETVLVARFGARVEIDPEALERVARSREVVDRCVADGRVSYGITTGFGKFSDVLISPDENFLLQHNLIVSHACGVGDPLPEEVVRAMALLRANALAVGYSGIRVETLLSLVNLLNAGIVPVVPEKGSLGASGDLAPLAHLVLVLIGEGEAFYRGTRMPGGAALKAAGLAPVVLAAKEGLALINGTQAMTSIAAIAVFDAWKLLRTEDVACALSFQALQGIVDALDPRVHALRGQEGQEVAAERLRALLEDSGFTTRQGQLRVQDAYALRCAPQVHGASRDALNYVTGIVERELNAVTDNPLIFPAGDEDFEDEPEEGTANPEGIGEDDIISGGNFHGQPIALAMDFLAIAMSELASIAERRIERLVNPSLSNGLPAFLTRQGGLNSGFMIAQYVAAALVSENKILAHPASVDSIPSSANQEDHVSMGTIAARKARSILGNLRSVVAIELLAACQAVELRAELMDIDIAESLSPATKAAWRSVRSAVPGLGPDRVMYQDIQAVEDIVAEGTALKAVEDVIGEEEDEFAWEEEIDDDDFTDGDPDDTDGDEDEDGEDEDAEDDEAPDGEADADYEDDTQSEGEEENK
ncbi:MAG: histidine ammonia-lyase [Treponema sp.]|nr:histidine ammonia-lyase [Treponema sp.]